MKVYTRLEGKLACWEIDTNDVFIAWVAVKRTLPPQHKPAILCLIEKPKSEEPEVA